MEPLDPELSHLVLAERSEVEPSAGDRERVAQSLGARVGVGLGLGLGLLSTPAAGAAVASSGLGLALKLSLALAVVGSAAVVAVPAWHGKPAPAAVSKPSAPVEPPHVEPVGENPAPSVVEANPTSDEPAPGKASGQVAPRALPPLAEEARLLKQAQQALQSGKAGAALAALAEHQRRFPRGQLGLERSAARITALCALGQKQQAEREAKAFLAQHSGSGLAAQVRASCGAGATH